MPCSNCDEKTKSKSGCKNNKFTSTVKVNFKSGKTGSFTFSFNSIPDINTCNAPKNDDFEKAYLKAYKQFMANSYKSNKSTDIVESLQTSINNSFATSLNCLCCVCNTPGFLGCGCTNNCGSEKSPTNCGSTTCYYCK